LLNKLKLCGFFLFLMLSIQPLIVLASTWSDDFNDNSMNTSYWYKLQYNGGTADETSNKLRLTIPSGTGQACAGYVTKNADTIDGRLIEIDVPEFDSLDEMIIMIATSQTTNTDPYSLSNWYRCLKTKYTAGDYDWYVQRKVSGIATTLEQWDTSGGTGELKISVDDGWIKFYEGDSLRYAEPYALGTTSIYVYIYTSTLRSRNSGTDYMDNFAYISYDSSYSKDDFTDTDYSNRWNWVSGSATVESGKFKMYNNGEQKTQAAYNDYRCVAAKVTTTQHGAEHWQVAWLVAKYIDWDNQIYGLLWPDGTVELAVRYGGDQHEWATASGSVSNPMSEHNWEIVLTGNHAVMLIDGAPKISATDNYFGSIHSEKLAVYGNSDDCVAKFDDIEVIDSVFYNYGIFGQTYPDDGGGMSAYFQRSIDGWVTSMSNSSWSQAQYHVDGTNAQNYWISSYDNSYSDSVNLAIYVGHGTPRSTLLDEYKMHVGLDTGPGDVLVKPSQCHWGDVTRNWIALEACELLYNPDGQLITDWDGVYHGLHGILGWYTEVQGPSSGWITIGQYFGGPFSRDVAIGTSWQLGTTRYYERHGLTGGEAAYYHAVINYGSGQTFDYQYESMSNLWPNYGTPGYILNHIQYDSWSCSA